MFIKKYPDQIELLGFFESEPIHNDLENLNFTYKFSDDNRVSLIFSFNVLEGWIQSIIKFDEVNLSQQLIENVSTFVLENDKSGEYLVSKIIFEECITEVEIRVKPNISVRWNTLLN